MQSTLSPKLSDDPCDSVVVAPNVVGIAPSDEELSNLLHQAARYRLATQASAASDFTAAPTSPPINAAFGATSANDGLGSEDARAKTPPVDAMVRPASANDVRGSEGRRSMAARLVPAFIALLLAACISLTAVAWKSYGEVVKKTIAMLTPQLVVASSQPEKAALAAQPAPPTDQADAANATSPASLTQTAPNAVAPSADSSPDSAQLLAHDLAALRQEVEELKASMEQLKASQQEMFRDIAKASEQNLRPGISAAPPRPAAPQTHKPARSLAPPHAAAANPALPPATAPYYVPRQPEPQSQSTFEPPADTELSQPRPPIPVR
jgi:hypothetical protein